MWGMPSGATGRHRRVLRKSKLRILAGYRLCLFAHLVHASSHVWQLINILNSWQTLRATDGIYLLLSLFECFRIAHHGLDI